MKLVMIITESHYREELEVLLAQHGIAGFTEFPEVHGKGQSGIRMGSGAYPKTSTVILTVVPKEKIAELKSDLECLCGEACLARTRMIAWDGEILL
ncbi:MAG TPA: hypothetical protein ENK19_07970 [Acidobacteria bacterium]|nr:hypothetical protein [Acidobacteriota bacterium]